VVTKNPQRLLMIARKTDRQSNPAANDDTPLF